MLSYELGVRTSASEKVQIDVATFYNQYEDLQTFELDTNGLTTYGNEARAQASGVELALDLDLTSAWRVRSSYSYFYMDFASDSNVGSSSSIDDKDGLVPKNHASLRSYYDLGSSWELDSGLYWTD